MSGISPEISGSGPGVSGTADGICDDDDDHECDDDDYDEGVNLRNVVGNSEVGIFKLTHHQKCLPHLYWIFSCPGRDFLFRRQN